MHHQEKRSFKKKKEVLVVDTVEPLSPSRNYRNILRIQYELLKYVTACPMKSKDAKTVAKTIVEQVILKYGLYNILNTDIGTEFTNKLIRDICVLLKLKQNFLTPYHHEFLVTV